MENSSMYRRKELADTLLADLEDTTRLLREAACAVENESGTYYELAFKERREEVLLETENHRRNTERATEINAEITALINSWYGFVKNADETGKLLFPLNFHLKRRSLFKRIEKLNKEISDIVINNRFIKEKLTILEHQLEIKAMSLARSGMNYQYYEKLQQKLNSLATELEYLLPTIKAAGT